MKSAGIEKDDKDQRDRKEKTLNFQVGGSQE